MKKIISLILMAIMCVTLSLTAVAEEQVISFPMMTSTGTITVKNSSKADTYFAPELASSDYIILKENNIGPKVASVILRIEGERNGLNYITTKDYPFANYMNDACTIRANKNGEGSYWRLGLNSVTAFNDEFLITTFSHIHSINIITTGYYETEDEKFYNEWGATLFETDKVNTFTIVKNFDNVVTLTELITDLINNIKGFTYESKLVKYDYPFLPNTDADYDNIITRNEVNVLSYSSLGYGNGIKGFEGLASQVAQFFNHKDNGTITFQITTAPSVTVIDWNNGGIPTAHNTLLATTTVPNDIMGLFFNYETTGSLVATSQINANGTVVFDITNILNEFDGNTAAFVKSLYYGLIGGVNYKTENIKGLKIDGVILSYTEPVAETDEVVVVTEPIETTPIVTTTTEIEEEIPIDVEDEDEDCEMIDDVIEDTDEADAEIIDETEDIPDTTITEEEDVNPRTGATLAVIPAIIAVLTIGLSSKKRK